MGSFGRTFIDCWCVNMRLDHQKGDVFVMVCVCVTCMQTYGCRTSCFERDHMLVLGMSLFFCSTAHIIHSHTHTRTHRISILLYLGNQHLSFLQREQATLILAGQGCTVLNISRTFTIYWSGNPASSFSSPFPIEHSKAPEHRRGILTKTCHGNRRFGWNTVDATIKKKIK